MRLRWSGYAMVVLSLGLLGVDACFYPLDEILDIPGIDDPDTRCAALASSNPPALAFERGGPPVWVVDPAPSRLAPFDVDIDPPMAAASGVVSVPGLGSPQAITFLKPLGIAGIPESLALVTATNQDAVSLLDATAPPKFLQFPVSVPNLLNFPTYPRLPLPGAVAETRNVLSTYACLDQVLLGPDARDSHEQKIPVGPADCTGFYTSTASGAAIGGTGPDMRLFVSVANPGTLGVGTKDPQFYPGAVFVFSLLNGAVLEVRPDAAVPVIFSTGYNPTQVTAYNPDSVDRHFILVTVSGVVGKIPDDPVTVEVERQYIAQTKAYIDVIDADTLELVATIPLEKAGLVGNLAIHPSGNYAVVGSMVERSLMVVDLTPLKADGFPPVPPTDVIVLDGSTPFGNAVVPDASNPYEIPHRAEGGADEDFCPGLIAGLAFNTSGTRLYATDYCDGTLSVIGAGSTPTLSPNPQLVSLTAPIDAADTTLPRGLGAIAVRPGDPGSFSGADVFVLVGEPSGLMCSVAVESGS